MRTLPLRRSIFVAASLSVVAGCGSATVVAPRWVAHGSTAITDAELPLAATELFVSDVHDAKNAPLAAAVADRLIARARFSFAHDREKSGLAALRIGTMLLRVSHGAPTALSDEAVAAIARGVEGPAARGDEGTAMGLYGLWGEARPADTRVGPHLGALEAWITQPADRSSALILEGRIATRISDSLAYASTSRDRASADQSLLRWMTGVATLKDSMSTREPRFDEVQWALLGLKTSGLRLVAGHLRDGDLAGAVDAIGERATDGFIEDGLRVALMDASASGSNAELRKIIAAIEDRPKDDRIDEPAGDAILGTALLGLAKGSHDPSIVEAVARAMVRGGASDIAPALLARAMLGTAEFPRQAKASELSRALKITLMILGDDTELEDFDGARRAFASADPILRDADAIGPTTPTTAQVRGFMGLAEAESGRAEQARALYDRAIASDGTQVASLARAYLRFALGDAIGAQADVDASIGAKDAADDPTVLAEAWMFAGDLARRRGDSPHAIESYKRSLAILATASGAPKHPSIKDADRLRARIFSHFEGASDAERDAIAASQRSAAGDPRVVGEVTLRAIGRAMRTGDLGKARAVVRDCVELGMSPTTQVRAATIARAMALRAAMPVDDTTVRVLTTAAARDDFAGKLARYALGTIDDATLKAAAIGPRAQRAAMFAIALRPWSKKDDAGARATLDSIVKMSLVPSVEGDLAADLIDPTRAAVPGA